MHVVSAANAMLVPTRIFGLVCCFYSILSAVCQVMLSGVIWVIWVICDCVLVVALISIKASILVPETLSNYRCKASQRRSRLQSPFLAPQICIF